MMPIICTEDELRAAFKAHKDAANAEGCHKFTRRMAIAIAEMAGVPPMSIVWRLEKMGLLKSGSWEWFKHNGGITKKHIEEAKSTNDALS